MPEKLGSQFLNREKPKLKHAKEVERAGKLREEQKPAKKIESFMYVLKKHEGHRDKPGVMRLIKEHYQKEYVTKKKI